MSFAPSPHELLFLEYVNGTEKKALVYLAKVAVCNLSAKVYTKLKELHILDNSKVFVNTKVLKHIYDDHHAQHLTIIRNLHRIIWLPDRVYKNKPGKGGDYLFVKKIRGKPYCVVIDIIKSSETCVAEIRTGFYVSYPDRYLKEHELVWMSKK